MTVEHTKERIVEETLALATADAKGDVPAMTDALAKLRELGRQLLTSREHPTVEIEPLESRVEYEEEEPHG